MGENLHEKSKLVCRNFWDSGDLVFEDWDVTFELKVVGLDRDFLYLYDFVHLG